MAMRLGAAQCLGKPVPIDQLVAVIKQIVGSGPDQARPSDPEVDCDLAAVVLPCVL
jgi:DNA-binding response OmpR family regulator